jgi:hypothetical protein
MRTRTLACLVLVATALVAAGCSGSDSALGAGQGQVRISLSAAPLAAASTDGGGLAAGHGLGGPGGPQITAASMTLSSVLARNLDGELIDVTIDLPAEIDLFALVAGQTVDLPIGSLPVGSYDQLVVVIRAVGVTLEDGTQIDITPPGGGWTAIVPTEPFEVTEGAATTVTLQFRAGRAFRWLNGQLGFHPEFDCDIDDGDDSNGDGGNHDDDDDDD